MRRAVSAVLMAGLSLFSASAWAQYSPCDLDKNGAVNPADVDLAINMALDLVPCSADIYGAGICNVTVVQRVINASMGGTCHTATLNWTASASSGVSGYNVHRATTSGGQYTKVNSSPIAGVTTYTDSTVAAGQTYYYVVTAVNSAGMESGYSNQAQAVVPSP